MPRNGSCNKLEQSGGVKCKKQKNTVLFEVGKRGRTEEGREIAVAR